MFKKDNCFFNLTFSVGSTILFFLFSIFTVTLVGFVFNIVIGSYVFVTSVVLTLFYILLINRYLFESTYKVSSFITLFFVIFSFLISYFISTAFSDLSFDGQSYHQEAIIQLVNGWNPLKHSLAPDVWDHTYAIWLNHFPKFSWICWSVIYKTFGNIETGKLVNILLVLSCFFFTYAITIYKNKKYFRSLVLSSLVAFNPIILYQFSSYYLDNQIASLIFILFFLIYFVFVNNSKVVYFFLSIVTILLINTKLTLIAYLPVLYLISLVVAYVLKRNDVLKRIFFTGLTSGLLSIFVFGYHPYVTTFIKYNNPFYPLYSFYPIKDLSNKNELESVIPALPHVTNIREFMYESNMPINFIGKKPIEKIFLSLFSKSSNLVPYSESGKEVKNDTTELKIPFAISKSEISPFNTTDVRIGGFGPLFSGVLLLSIGLLICVFILNKKVGLILLLINFGIFTSAMINSELWWARYVPQLWLIPISMIMACLLIVKNRYLSFFSYVISCIIVVNLGLISINSIRHQYYESEYRQKYFDSLSYQFKINQVPVLLDFNSFRANRILYKQLGISYLETAVEIGVMENHIFPKISEINKTYLLKFYKKDLSTYKYNIDILKLSESEIKNISSIMNSNDLMLNVD